MPSQPSPLMAGTCRIGRFRPNCSLEREQEDGAFRILRPRGREWVVLCESTTELLMLRPVGGIDDEVAEILLAVEPVESATFRLPGWEDLGDFTFGQLLRDAARLSSRAATNPFRSFGRIAVEPRPISSCR